MSSDDPKPTYRNILAFHRIQKKFSYSPNNFSPRRFDKLLAFLKEKGYSISSLNDVIENPGKNKIAITFDDGYAHLAGTLPEFMEKYDFQPTVFVPTYYIGKKNKWDYNFKVYERVAKKAEKE